MASAGATVVRIGVDSSRRRSRGNGWRTGRRRDGGRLGGRATGGDTNGEGHDGEGAPALRTPSARFLQQGTVCAMPTVWTSRTVVAVMFGS